MYKLKDLSQAGKEEMIWTLINGVAKALDNYEENSGENWRYRFIRDFFDEI